MAILSAFFYSTTMHSFTPNPSNNKTKKCTIVNRDEDIMGLPDKEIWMSPNFFFDMKKGDADAHSVLLCNLFLGLGVDAYICVGALRHHSRQHQWVMTREADGSVLFWETVKGAPYVLPARWKGTGKRADEADEAERAKRRVVKTEEKVEENEKETNKKVRAVAKYILFL
jgi:hypothetical protein